jgi:hypothetical protein
LEDRRVILSCVALSFGALYGCIGDTRHIGAESTEQLEVECSISDVEVVDYVELQSDPIEVAIVDRCAIEALRPYRVSTTERVHSKFENGLNPNFAPFSYARIMLAGLQIEKSGETYGFPVQLRRHLSCVGKEWQEGTFGQVYVDLDERRVLRAVIFRVKVEVKRRKGGVTEIPLVRDQEELPSGYKECVL